MNKSQFVLYRIGGCRKGKDSSEGVVKSFGEVFQGWKILNVVSTVPYVGLYVIDGAIIPVSLGVNPRWQSLR